MSSNKDFLPSSCPISSKCTIEIEAILFLFMMNCYKSSFQECITIIVLKIERTRNQPPYCLLQLQEKRGIPPPPVGLSWDSPLPPPESVRAGGRTDVRWRQNQNFSDQRVTKFAYPWCSASSAINITFTDKILKLRSMKYKPLEPSLKNSGPLWSSWKLLLSASFKFSVVLEQNLQFCLI